MGWSAKTVGWASPNLILDNALLVNSLLDDPNRIYMIEEDITLIYLLIKLATFENLNCSLCIHTSWLSLLRFARGAKQCQSNEWNVLHNKQEVISVKMNRCGNQQQQQQQQLHHVFHFQANVPSNEIPSLGIRSKSQVHFVTGHCGRRWPTIQIS